MVDLGTYATSAAIAVGGRIHCLSDPVTGSPRWPSSAAWNGASLAVAGVAEQCRDAAPGQYVAAIRRLVDADEDVWLGDRKFTGSELISAYLRVVIAEAQRLHGRVDRLALTVPPGYQAADPRRELMLSAAEAAGFPDAELVSDVVTASIDGATGLGLPTGALVLVCDLGATWTVGLVEHRGGATVPVAQQTSGAGRDIDQMLLQHLRVTLPDVVEPLLAQDGDAGARAYYQAGDFVRETKHRLSEAEQVSERLPGADRPYQITRGELERFAEPALRWLMASCRAVVAQAGITLADVAAVVLAGAGSRLPAARMMIHVGLGRPVWQPDQPELATVHGAARWATGVARRVRPERPKWRVEPLCWRIPHGEARIVRWLVAEDQPFAAGTPLAQVRASDDRVYDLIAEWEGVLLEHRLPAGAVVASAAVAAMARSAAPLAGGQLAKRHHLRSGDWLLSSDRRRVIECGAGGGYVRVRDIATGVAVAEARSGPNGAGRTCVAPDGRLAFVTWDRDGQFVVWDVLSGTAQTRFKAPHGAAAVRVDEARWRVFVESGKRVQVGRYQRDIATVWDLRTGNLIEDLVGEDLHRRFAGLTDRTADAFATEADSPDGRLRAVALPATGVPVAVSVRETTTGREIFRADGSVACTSGETVQSARVGFTPDGRYLVVNWRTDTGGWLDVWEM